MKRLTITFDDDIYYPILQMANERNTTFRKIVMEILWSAIYKPKELLDTEQIAKDVKECLHLLDEVKEKQYIHYKVSSQHFVNHGYFTNANPSESVSYQQLMEECTKNKFND